MSKQFLEVTPTEVRYPGNVLLDIDTIISVTEILEEKRGDKLPPATRAIIVIAAGKDIQSVPVSDSFNDIRDRLSDLARQ